MSVFQRSQDNKWCAQWYENKKQKRKYFSTQQEAISFMAEQNRENTREERLTVGELVIMFYRANQVHIKTKSNVVSLLAGRDTTEGKHIEGKGEFLRDKYIDSLTRVDLEQLRENLRASGSSNNTINKYQAYLRAIFAWGVDQDFITINPWRDYKRLPVKRRLVHTSLKDFKKILEHCPDWLKWAFATAYALSLRFGQVELFSLQWNSFMWEYGFVQLYQAKTGMVKRVFPPKEYLIEARKRYDEDMKNGVQLVCHKNGSKVFSYRSAWQKALRESGMSNRGIRPYDIRHVSASEMLAGGADLAAVSAQLGHSSVTTTGTTYAHVTAGTQERAAALLPNIWQKK